MLIVTYSGRKISKFRGFIGLAVRQHSLRETALDRSQVTSHFFLWLKPNSDKPIINYTKSDSHTHLICQREFNQ